MINTEVIRKKVIDLAIQGKLTQQLPEDGEAEDLYAQIQNEKAILIKEGKITKEKSLTEIFDEEIPFEIPNNWKWVRLGSVCTGMLVPQRDKPKQFDGDVPWCRIEDIEGKYLNGTKSNKFVSRETIESMDLRVNPIGTVISACSASIGAAAICTVECITNQTFIGLVCSKGLYNEYLFYFLKASIKSLKQLGTGMTISYISQDKYRDLLLPLPPLAEQKRIVTRIEEICVQIDIIDALQQQYESDREILKGKIIDAGIQGRLTEQLPEDGDAEVLYKRIQENNAKLEKEGKIKKQKQISSINEDEIPFEIPSNWRWYRLGSIARIYGGKRIPAGRSLTDLDTGHKYIRISDMKDGTVLVNNLLYVPEDIYPSISRYIINKEDVYITVAGTIGKVGKIPSEIDGANLTENADRIVFDSIDQNWLIWCLSASFIQKQIVKLTTQVAQPKLAITRIQEFIIPLPPLAEQIRIANVIDTLMQTISY